LIQFQPLGLLWVDAKLGSQNEMGNIENAFLESLLGLNGKTYGDWEHNWELKTSLIDELIIIIL
jgi:hypothetical protein